MQIFTRLISSPRREIFALLRGPEGRLKNINSASCKAKLHYLIIRLFTSLNVKYEIDSKCSFIVISRKLFMLMTDSCECVASPAPSPAHVCRPQKKTAFGIFEFMTKQEKTSTMMAPTKNMDWAKFGRQSSSQTQLLCTTNKYKRTDKVHPSKPVNCLNNGIVNGGERERGGPAKTNKHTKRSSSKNRSKVQKKQGKKERRRCSFSSQLLMLL